MKWLVLLLSASAFAADKDFPVTLHINSSYSAREATGSSTTLGNNNIAIRRRTDNLSATVNGHNYELRSVRRGQGVLDPGDYPARFIEHGSQRIYEIQLPNGKSEKFEVVGAS